VVFAFARSSVRFKGTATESRTAGCEDPGASDRGERERERDTLQGWCRKEQQASAVPLFTLGLPPAAAPIIPTPQKPALDSAFYLKIPQYISLRKESIISQIKMF